MVFECGGKKRVSLKIITDKVIGFKMGFGNPILTTREKNSISEGVLN